MRVTVAALAAYSVYHLLSLPQGYWAVFTTVIVVQTSIGATLTVSLERLIGTLVGALVGGVAAAVHPQTPLGLGVALAIAVAVTAFGAAVRSDLKVAPVTAVIMLISPSGANSPVVTALLRVSEIGLGSVIGVAATLLIFPARAHQLAARRIQAVLGDIAALIEAAAARLEGETRDISPLSASIRRSLTGVEAAIAEAARERSSRLLGEDRLPEAFPRTLWRVRNDAATLAAAAETGLPEPAGAHLRPAAAALLAAEAAFARTCGAALLSRAPLDRGPLDRADDAFQARIEAMRREHLTSDLTVEEIGPYFGVVFAAESLHRNLNDLADRVEEANGRAVGPAADAEAAAL